MSRGRPRAAVVGIEGVRLSATERALFDRAPPAAFILFGRNCVDREQLRRLTAELEALVPGRRTPVLVDQEGGRVARLCPPCWRGLPAPGRVGGLADADATRAAWLLGRLIAVDLAEVGIRIACAPCTDLAVPGATSAIGDRAFSSEPERVAALAGACADGLRAGGVAPVMKHLPGHGRALVDSHVALPTVAAPIAELDGSDFLPPRALARTLDLAMTAHVLYSAIDAARPGTLSSRVIGEVIRGSIGFRGVLLSDDLAMSALRGAPEERALAALEAGCNLALYCPGDGAANEAVLEAVPEAGPDLLARLDLAIPPGDRAYFDADAARAELDGLVTPAPALIA